MDELGRIQSEFSIIPLCETWGTAISLHICEVGVNYFSKSEFSQNLSLLGARVLMTLCPEVVQDHFCFEFWNRYRRHFSHFLDFMVGLLYYFGMSGLESGDIIFHQWFMCAFFEYSHNTERQQLKVPVVAVFLLFDVFYSSFLGETVLLSRIAFFIISVRVRAQLWCK